MTGAGSHPLGALAATFLKKQREGGGGTEMNVGSFTPLKPIIFLPSGLWPLCQIKKGQELASFLVLSVAGELNVFSILLLFLLSHHCALIKF